MTAPTLTSEQREALDGCPECGHSIEDMHLRSGGCSWPCDCSLRDAHESAIAVMVADAAHEAEAIKAAAIRVLQVAQPDGADDDGFITGYRFKTGALHALAAQLPGHLLLVPEKDTNRIDALAKELADLRGAVETLADEWEGATCQTDGAPCSWHRVAGECATDLRALLNASSNP